MLSKISGAQPKIADYPFTTLKPNLGIVKYGEYKSFVMADIPGLIEGAHEGIGLGDKFLRHIERCKNILHLIDITNDNLIENYSKVRKELFKYSNKLTKKKEIVVFNKIDMANDEEINEKVYIFNKKIKKKIYKISSVSSSLVVINEVLLLYL